MGLALVPLLPTQRSRRNYLLVESVYNSMSASGKNNWPDLPTALLYGGIFFVVVLIFFRVSPPIATTLLLLGLLGLPYLGFHYYKQYRADHPKSSDDAFGRRVAQRYKDCRAKEEQFRTEAGQIRESIAALRDDIERSAAADAGEIVRANNLISDFEAEFNLRHAKAAFFADCATKLKSLLDRYQLQQSILIRKRELDALRSANFDDEAALEETRFHLERDTIELDTIAALSKEAFVSFKAEQADELRLRLEKLRGEL